MMPFSIGTGLERVGSLGWTKTADGLNWWMLDRLGWGRIDAMSTCRFGCGTPLQKELEGRRAGKGFARGRSDA